ncbi:MAG: alpha-amylase [bacterium]|nr:alpha-amylase [bacterium]
MGMPSGMGPRLYNLFPLLVGPVSSWKRHLERIARMGFDWVYLNPFHEVGFSGSLYAVKDYYRLHPFFRGQATAPDDEILRDFVRAARDRGLDVMMDLVVNHTAKDSLLAQRHPAWFLHDSDGGLHSPAAVHPDDPTDVTVWGDLAELDYAERPERAEIVSYFRDVATHYARLGFRGFRCDAAYKVPGTVWSEIVAGVRGARADAVFVAETLGCKPEEVRQLAAAGFDFLFNSAKWWDFRAAWLLEQYEAFRTIAPSIAFPESHDTERLIVSLEAQSLSDPAQIEAAYRFRYLFAAFFSSGVAMPIGFEFGFRRRLDVVRTRPEDWEEPRFDLEEFIAEVNAMKARTAALCEEGPQHLVTAAGAWPLALRRQRIDGSAPVLGVFNPDAASSARLDVTQPPFHVRDLALRPLEGRVLAS